MKTLEDLERVFDRGLNEWETNIVKSGLQKMGQRLVGAAKDATPVDTGNLRRTWFFNTVNNRIEKRVELCNNTEYAPHINYGHRVVIGGKTVGRVKGYFMLEKTIGQYRKNYLEKDINAMLERLKGAIK